MADVSLFFVILLWSLSGFLVLATLLPISKVPFGAIRGLDFPKQQYFLIACGMGIATLVFYPGWLGGYGAYGLFGIAAIQAIYIAKFTPVWPTQSVRADAALQADASRRVSMIAANVKKSNRDYGALVDLVKAERPDLVMAIETDAAWIDALKEGLGTDFDHWVEAPMDNGYGMCVMSVLPLDTSEVRMLVTRNVPSVKTTVRLRNGALFRLYVVHPEPPVFAHDTKGRDSEIALVGLEATKDDLPAVVAGDLNDVAWSTTTRRFQRLSGLLDPRVGRGFFNTFSATMPWMRWPLDHLFHDARFRLVGMARLGKIGSDHFPMWFELALERTPEGQDTIEASEPGERHGTKRMIVEERKRTRDPIGGDWEDE